MRSFNDVEKREERAEGATHLPSTKRGAAPDPMDVAGRMKQPLAFRPTTEPARTPSAVDAGLQAVRQRVTDPAAGQRSAKSGAGPKQPSLHSPVAGAAAAVKKTRATPDDAADKLLAEHDGEPSRPAAPDEQQRDQQQQSQEPHEHHAAAPTKKIPGKGTEGKGAAGAAAETPPGADARTNHEMDASLKTNAAGSPSGAPLPPSVRGWLEASIGKDLGDVRLHTGKASAAKAATLASRAFTSGKDIHFADGAYQPDKPEGLHLIAHEVAHTQQQGDAPGPVQAKGRVSDAGEPLEREADRVADAAVAGEQAPPISRGGDGVIHRDPDPNAEPAPQPPAPEQPAQALSAMDVAAIEDYGSVSVPERLTYVAILNQAGQPLAAHLFRLWQSFGDSLRSVADANLELWNASVSVLGGGVLNLVPSSLRQRMQSEFEGEARGIADDNLRQNIGYVDERMQEFGIKEGGDKLSEAEQETLRIKMQSLAKSVWTMRQSQKKAEETQIGAELTPGPFIGIRILMGKEETPVYFNPRHPPHNPHQLALWSVLKEDWDRAQRGISDAAAAHPEIYELVASGDDAALLNLSSAEPQAFSSKQQEVLEKLRARIVEVQGKVDSGDLDVLAFRSMLDRMTAPGARWGQGFDHEVATAIVDDRANSPRTAQTVAESATVAAMILAPFASTGLGTVLEAIAIGVAVTAAAIDYKNTSAQAEASRATPKSGTELLDRLTADEAKAAATAQLVETAILAAVAAIAGAIAAGSAIYEAVQLSRLRTVIKEEQLLAELMAKVPDKGALYRLAANSGDPVRLSRLLTKYSPAQLEALLAETRSAAKLEELLVHVEDPVRLQTLFKKAGGAKRLGVLFEELGTVEKVEAKLAANAAGESAGFADPAIAEALAESGTKLSANWAKMSPQQRLQAAMRVLARQAEVEGMPQAKAVATAVKGKGAFNAATWQIEIGDELVADAAAAGEADPAGKLTSTLLHEQRHVDQVWQAARAKAAQGMTAEEIAAPTAEGGLNIPRRIAEQAVANPLPLGSSQAKFGLRMFKAFATNDATRVAVHAEVDAAKAAVHKAEMKWIDEHLAARARTGQLDPVTKEVLDARKALNAANAKYDAAYAKYRALPEEADAFAAEDAYKARLDETVRRANKHSTPPPSSK